MPTSVYAVTTFLSAFLLFAVQPMLAKAILPWFGGTAAVWTVCLMFFQGLLLLGYLYAHASIRYVPSRLQGPLHLLLLILSLLSLPVLPDPSWKPTGADEPTMRIVLLLLMTVGLPYFLLSSTGSLLQAWYVRQPLKKGEGTREKVEVGAESAVTVNNQTETEREGSAAAERSIEEAGRPAAGKVYPYWLYAVSNAGSLLALLSYPIGVEPSLTLPQQAWGWSGGYVLFALLCGVVALAASRKGVAVPAPVSGELDPDAPVTSAPSAPAPTSREYLLWGGLVFTSTTLLLSITTHLTQNIAPVPFLWVAPLSLYLLSFILVFGAKGWRWNLFWQVMIPIAILLLGASIAGYGQDYSYLLLIPLNLVAFFFACMACHGELSRTKPDPAYLTSYYLTVSAGGALAGIFVGLIAPLVFIDYYELPLSITLCAVAALYSLYPLRNRWRNPFWLAGSGVTLVLLFLLGRELYIFAGQHRVTTRNFYGMMRVFGYSNRQNTELRRVLVHGTIYHGMQIIRPPERRHDATTYFGPYSGVRLALLPFEKQPKARVGIIGLGTGTLAVYAQPGHTYRFYEINPEVLDVALSEFTFLEDCRGTAEVALGDARLTLEREPPQGYDVFVVDAFSSDSIPTHLLTKEAMQLYFRHLKPDGILAVHVSNRYLNLRVVVKKLADELGLQCKIVSNSDREELGIKEADWVLVTNRPGFWDSEIMKMAARPIKPRPGLRTWTDNYSNLLQIME